MSDKIVRFYSVDANPDSATLPGVPLADIDQATWDDMPAWLQESVDATGYYTKTKRSQPSAAESGKRTAGAAEKEG